MKSGVSLLMWACLVYVLGASNGAWIGNAEEETRFCRSVCDKCGCMGFSCGEECLCECHQKKIGDKYMACITDARSHVTNVDDMEYDIVVQGPNGNGRISRSVVTKEVNPEDIFPPEFVFNAADDLENAVGEDVAASHATPSNIQNGLKLIKTLEINKLPAPVANLPAPTFKALDRDALRHQFEDWRKNLADRVPAPPAPPAVNLPELPSLSELKLKELEHLNDLPKVVVPAPHAPAPPPPPPPAPTHNSKYAEFKEKVMEVFKPHQFKETFQINVN